MACSFKCITFLYMADMGCGLPYLIPRPPAVMSDTSSFLDLVHPVCKVAKPSCMPAMQKIDQCELHNLPVVCVPNLPVLCVQC